jgi:L-ascorbate metabolism protein UlaG (beta-lactamase superfamily)
MEVFMQLILLRHATMVLYYDGVKILTDPMLGAAGSVRAVPTKKKGRGRRNPLVDLPVKEDALRTLLSGLDAVLVTHTHFDHFDSTAGEMLPKHIPIFCQDCDCERLKETGFQKVLPIQDCLQFQGISIAKTSGRHGGLLTRKKMGVVSGFVLSCDREPTFYIAGDTIWCPDVRDAISRHRPGVIVVNAGAAQLPIGRPITMNAHDIARVMRHAPLSKVVAVHMEAINHCLQDRRALAERISKTSLPNRLLVPAEGGSFRF